VDCKSHIDLMDRRMGQPGPPPYAQPGQDNVFLMNAPPVDATWTAVGQNAVQSLEGIAVNEVISGRHGPSPACVIEGPLGPGEAPDVFMLSARSLGTEGASRVTHIDVDGAINAFSNALGDTEQAPETVARRSIAEVYSIDVNAIDSRSLELRPEVAANPRRKEGYSWTDEPIPAVLSTEDPEVQARYFRREANRPTGYHTEDRPFVRRREEKLARDQALAQGIASGTINVAAAKGVARRHGTKACFAGVAVDSGSDSDPTAAPRDELERQRINAAIRETGRYPSDYYYPPSDANKSSGNGDGHARGMFGDGQIGSSNSAAAATALPHVAGGSSSSVTAPDLPVEVLGSSDSAAATAMPPSGASGSSGSAIAPISPEGHGGPVRPPTSSCFPRAALGQKGPAASRTSMSTGR
jgi:hypothetical protein